MGLITQERRFYNCIGGRETLDRNTRWGELLDETAVIKEEETRRLLLQLSRVILIPVEASKQIATIVSSLWTREAKLRTGNKEDEKQADIIQTVLQRFGFYKKA